MTATAPTSLWEARTRWTTIGSLVLVLLAAFEAMAVTTVMPLVAEELNGEALYAVAFSATLAASVIAMVAAGRWSDRSGPGGPLVAGVLTFLAGLVVAGTALVMPVLVLGRFLQGLGAGAITVTLYVLVARLYPPALQPRIFGLFSAAWVVPSMVGPYLAGVIAEHASWHWVFLGVALIEVPALALLVPALRTLRAQGGGAGPDGPVTDDTPAPVRPSTGAALGLAVVVALGLVGVGTLADVAAGWVWFAVALVLVVVALAVRPLLPAGTLRAGRGLPATVAVRGTLAAAYFGTEVYLPLLMQREHGLTASRAGLVLTVGAVSWSLGSAVQARLGLRTASTRLVVAGSSVVALAVAVQVASTLLELGPWGSLVGWLIGGFGMGLAFPRITMLVLGHSATSEQGTNSAALAISDAVGASAITAVTGVLFASVGGAGAGAPAFAACFTLALVVGVVTVLVARRTAVRGQPTGGESGRLPT